MIEEAKHLTIYLYKHHFVRYLVVGGTTFLIDFGLLIILHSELGIGIAAATSVAYWVSIIYNFTLNRYWTFDVRERKSLQRHITIYLLLLIFNYFFVVVFVSYGSNHINYLVAKLIAVIMQICWTYPVYKNYIFIKNDKLSS